MNRITKASSKDKDYELLVDTSKKYFKAYSHSKSVLSGCALGQAHKGYERAIDTELKISKKLNKLLDSFEKKYNLTMHEQLNLSSLLEELPKKLGIIKEKTKKELLNEEYKKACEAYTNLPAYKRMMKELIASYDDPESDFCMSKYNFLLDSPEQKKTNKLRELIQVCN